MNTCKTSIIALNLTLLISATHAQSSFQNLNFEQANPISSHDPLDAYAVTPASALPGWTASIGGVPVTEVQLNTFSLGAAWVNIFGPQWNGGPGRIDGNYTLFLQPGPDNQGNGSYTTSIAQTGTIPAWAESLTFDVYQPPFALPFSVSIEGNVLSPVVLSTGKGPTGQSYNVDGVDISQYAGDYGQLEFTVYPNNYNSLLLDDIEFSPNPLPEPGPLVLTGIGGLIFALHRRFRQR